MQRALINQYDTALKYGAKIPIQVLHSAHIGDLENITVFLKSGLIGTIEPGLKASWEGGKRYLITLGWFRTEAEAKKEGQLFSRALLLSAISLDIGFTVESQPKVFDRSKRKMHSWGEMCDLRKPSAVLDEIINNYDLTEDIDQKLLLSMELYCAAYLDLNQRSRFITLVSAIEPLAEQKDLTSEVSSFVECALCVLQDSPEIDNSLRPSLEGRLKELQRESVTQAIRRLFEKRFPNSKDIYKKFSYAYTARSDLLHYGEAKDPKFDIATESVQISKILRALYSQSLGKSFQRPIGI